jgi:TetR/AcrR family transcriptional regulator, cholesterol catabolism regulator
VSSNQERRSRAPVEQGRKRVDGAKRAEILAAATVRFGRDGYEHTKWADIAADVGVGPTALYHYFESKQHCLYEVMGDAMEDFRGRFASCTSETHEPLKALVAVTQDYFTISEREVLRNRVLVAEQGLLATPSTSPRLERARKRARARGHELHGDWAGLLSRAMEVGSIPATDPKLLARAILGLYNSIWQWYRPGGTVPLPVIGDFFTDRVLAMVGVDPGAVTRRRMAA